MYIESKGPYVLTEAGILAPGSLLGFLSGKNYHRCKRIHPLLAAATERLHLAKFMTTIDEEYVTEIKTALSSFTLEDFNITLKDSSLASFYKKYDEFRTKTLSGEHGSTAQWMLYVSFVGLYHKFSRAIRTGDYQPFIYTIPDFINMFFAFNHQNYARWLTRYYNNLLNMDITHPGITDLFNNGAISIGRSTTPFARKSGQ